MVKEEDMIAKVMGRPRKVKVVKLDTDKAINKIYELEREILELRAHLAPSEKKAVAAYKATVSLDKKLVRSINNVQKAFDSLSHRISKTEDSVANFNFSIVSIKSIEAKCLMLEKLSTGTDNRLGEKVAALEHTIKSLFNYKNFIESTDPSVANKVSNNLSEYYFTFDHICSLLCAKAELKYGVDSHEFKRIHLSVLELRGAFSDVENSSVD